MSEEYFAIVVSDLHLGEEDSIFMDLEGQFQPKVAEKIKNLIASKTDPQKLKYLILAGDAMDLSLASRPQAFKAFRGFLEKFYDLFETLIYIPGNHDHHIWIALQEEALIFSRIRQGKPAKEYYHALSPTITDCGLIHFPGSRKVSTPYGLKTFLYKLLPEQAEDDGKGFLVAYPNIYLDSGQKVLITHGHFLEEAWTIFTDALPKSLGLSLLTYKLLEQINSPFIEFGWYHIGQAGKLSKLVEDLWDELHAGRYGKMDGVADEIAEYLDRRLEFRPRNKKSFLAFLRETLTGRLKEAGSDILIYQVLIPALKRLIMAQISPESPQTPGSSLRHSADIITDPRKKERVRRYVEIAANGHERFPVDTLVFGHTHVPFEKGKLTINTLQGAKEIKCCNTGGWVADLLEAEHLSLSRPLIFGVKCDGTVEAIDIPWPSYSDFEKLTEEITDETKLKEKIKELIWRKL